MDCEPAMQGEDGLPLQGIQVVLTRPPGASHALSGAFTRLGANVRVEPLIETHVMITPQLQAAVAEWSTFDALVFTSATAVRAVEQAFAECGKALSVVEIPIFTVGQATNGVAEDLGIPALHPPGVANAGQLAKHFVERWADHPGQRVWWPCGRLAKPVMRHLLTEAGHVVTATVCYDTVDVRVNSDTWNEVLRQPTTYVCFHSPSAVASLVRQTGAGLSGDVSARFVCIGDTTGAACTNHGLSVAGIAEAPTDESLVSTVLMLTRCEDSRS